MTIKKILKIGLGIDFILLALSVILMNIETLKTFMRQLHPILGIILLLLGAIHIISHWRKK
jgi:hypothetical protein